MSSTPVPASPRAASSSSRTQASRLPFNGETCPRGSSRAKWLRQLGPSTARPRPASTIRAPSNQREIRPACRIVRVCGRFAGSRSMTCEMWARSAVRTRSAQSTAAASSGRLWCDEDLLISAGARSHPVVPTLTRTPAERVSKSGSESDLAPSRARNSAEGDLQMLAVQTYRIFTEPKPLHLVTRFIVDLGLTQGGMTPPKK